MRVFSRVLIVILALTLIGGVAIAGYLVYTESGLPAPPPPSIEFSSVEVGDVVTVAVTAHGDRVTRAELWNDNQLIAREINPNPALSNPWSVAWQWQPPHPGIYPLAARAFDDSGRYGGTALFTVVVPPREHLLFSSNREGGYALYDKLINTRETQLFQPPTSSDRQPNVISNTVAFAASKNAAWHIFTRPFDKNKLTDITPDLTSAQRPAWSPDGTKLAFEVANGSTTNIFVSDADGKNRHQITTSDQYDGQATFNPTGDHIAFAANQGGLWDIYTVALDGSNLTRITADPAQDAQPAWSPDGKRIAFASNRDGISQIYVMDANGGNPTRMTNFPSGAEQPTWSPDGNWLAFVAYTGAATGDNRREIYLLYAPPGQTNPDAYGLIRLTQNSFDDTDPAWVAGEGK